MEAITTTQHPVGPLRTTAKTNRSLWLPVAILTILFCLTPSTSERLASLSGSACNITVRDPSYSVQVFNSDPMILYIKNFLSTDEIAHIVDSVESRYETSRVWGDEVGHIDTSIRSSESAVVPFDHTVKNIEMRARSLMGWRNDQTRLEPMKAQRYFHNGFYSFHYDWIHPDDGGPEGNRVATFMIYLEANCTGGGTNFPRIPKPKDRRWCNIIACDGDIENEEYPGVTFKPIAGSAIFWENFHPNGTPHAGTRHASLPVRSGHKTGLNIWSWDDSWTL